MITSSSFVVVGSGLSGLIFALRAADRGSVMILTKRNLMDSNTSHAQGGIAAVMSEVDAYQYHIEDTLAVGQGLCDRRIVELLVRKGPEGVRWLMELGVDFDSGDRGLDLSQEGGHSRRRVVHVGDQTGKAVQEVLVRHVLEHENISVMENVIAVDLLIRDGRCQGVRAIDLKRSKIVHYTAPITVLATGGVGQLYSKTSNPQVATGDGPAMAWWAGAELKDMEFVQFHPTVLNIGTSPFFLISETVRGEGGVLLNSRGDAFMRRIHILGDLAPRDVVARAIVDEQRNGPVYLDIRHRNDNFLKKRFPTIYQKCMENGLSITHDLIPVSPAAHYICGGIKTNEYGETNIPGLLAFGECACTAVHGANRLASNSLLECVVITSLAFEKIHRNFPESGELLEKDIDLVPTPSADILRTHLQDLMWDYAGINRNTVNLRQVISELMEIEERGERLYKEGLSMELIELHNMVTVAKLIVRAALTRRESRGTHYLADRPERDDVNWLKHIAFIGNKIKIEESY